MLERRDLTIECKTFHITCATILKYLAENTQPPPKSRSDLLHKALTMLFDILVSNKAIKPITYTDEAKKYIDNYFGIKDAGMRQGKNLRHFALNVQSEDRLVTRDGVVIDKEQLDMIKRDIKKAQEKMNKPAPATIQKLDNSPIVDTNNKEQMKRVKEQGGASQDPHNLDDPLEKDFEKCEEEQIGLLSDMSGPKKEK